MIQSHSLFPWILTYRHCTNADTGEEQEEKKNKMTEKNVQNLGNLPPSNNK